jgi:hypothetical protein
VAEINYIYLSINHFHGDSLTPSILGRTLVSVAA